MAISSDDDFETMLNSIREATKDINPKITLDLQHKTITCYLCKETVKVDRDFRWVETCPPCVKKLREKYVKHHHRLFE
jgi:uncharacterized CHY-type Zn-finger protein